jgi:glyoxylase-like metal-dependent hydrolase (beta-lactamase superfamily II)
VPGVLRRSEKFIKPCREWDHDATSLRGRSCGLDCQRARCAGATASAGAGPRACRGAGAATATDRNHQGPDNVYIFRYVGHQAMFIVTPAGVIATDPISLRRPAKPYIDAIQAVTKAPIKYVIYSHSHFDHTAGGQPFKDLGATFVAQRNAKARIQALKPADVVVPDQVVDDKKVITLGGTTLELLYLGKNHSDSTLVMRLPKEKIIFTVDWIPIQGVQFRGMADTYIPDIEDGLKKVIALDWETLIPGHPGPGGKQTGTKDNARDQLAYLQDLSTAVKQEVAQGKSYDDAVKDISLPKYAAWPNYKAFLPMNIERYYDFWNRGI